MIGVRTGVQQRMGKLETQSEFGRRNDGNVARKDGADEPIAAALQRKRHRIHAQLRFKQGITQ